MSVASHHVHRAEQPFDIVVASGDRLPRRVRIQADPEATVVALLDAVRIERTVEVRIDGSPVDVGMTLVEVGLHHGSVLHAGPDADRDPVPAPWALAVVGGTEGGTLTLPQGESPHAFRTRAATVVVGRSEALAVHFLDGEVHHVHRVPGALPPPPDPVVRLPEGTSLRVVPVGEPGARRTGGTTGSCGPWFRTFGPAPRPSPRGRPAEPAAADASRTAQATDPALVATLLSSLAMGLLMLTLLGGRAGPLRVLLGVTVAVPALFRIGLEVQRAARRRRRSAESAACAAKDWATWRSHLRLWAEERAPDPIRLRAVAEGVAEGRWARRPGDADLVQVGIGEVRCADLPEGPGRDGAGELWEPVLVELGVLGIVGTDADTHAVARWVVAQLVVRAGPSGIAVDIADLDVDGSWSWATWLPHVGREPITAAARRVVVTASADVDPGPCGVVLARSWSQLPACVSTVLVLGSDGASTTSVDLGTGARIDGIRPTGLARAAAEGMARALAPLVEIGPTATLPPLRVALVELLAEEPTDPAAVRAAWERAADRSGLVVPVGRTATGVLEIDLVADGPHALVVGTTGSGKSELLRSWILALAATYSPSDVAFVLVDFKGGATFDGLRALPHVVAAVDDLNGGADRLLRGLRAEMRRRERALRRAGIESLDVATGSALGLGRLVVVIDEFAALASDRDGQLDDLVAVARSGRSLGVHLVLATQLLDGAVPAALRANVALHVDLRTVEGPPGRLRDEAKGVVRRRPGRAVVTRGDGSSVVAQIARVGGRRPGPAAGEVWVVEGELPAGERTEDAVAAIVTAVDRAARGAAAPTSALTPPLPTRLSAADITASAWPGASQRPGALWIEDLVDEGVHSVDGPSFSEGGVLVVGPPGDAVCAAVGSLLWAGFAAPPDAPGEAYLVTSGDPGEVWRPAGVEEVHVLDVERLQALVRRLRSRPGRHGPDLPAPVRAVVAVDDLARCMSLGGAVLEELLDVLVGTFGSGIRTVIGSSSGRVLRGPLSSVLTERFLLAGADPAEMLLPGSPMRSPIRGRALRVRSGAWVQFVDPTSLPLGRGQRDVDAVVSSCTPTLPVLPADVDVTDLGPVRARPGGGIVVPVGIGGDPLGPVTVSIGPGEVVVAVVASTRVAERLAAAWEGVVPRAIRMSCAVVVVDGRTPVDSTAAALDAEQAVLVVVPLDRVGALFGHWATRLPAVGWVVEETVLDRAADAFGLRGERSGPLPASPGVARLVVVGDGSQRLRLPCADPPPDRRSWAA